MPLGSCDNGISGTRRRGKCEKNATMNHGPARVPAYLLHLETMGTLADRLAALIAEMEESDRRLAALVTDTRELIARTEAELAEERPE